MNDFENRLSSANQKKFVDIIPPSKGRIGPKKYAFVPNAGGGKKDSSPANEKGSAKKKEISKASFSAKRAGKARGNIEIASVLIQSLKYCRRLLVSLPKVFLCFALRSFSEAWGSKTFGSKKPRMFSIPKIPSLKMGLVFFAAFVLIGIGVWGFRELPRVKIVLHPVVLEHTRKASFEGRTNAAQIDYEKGVLPLELLSFILREDREFPSTGIEERILKARGVITVFNAYSSQSQLLVERTRFISEDGHLFRTTKKMTIPGAKVEGGTITPSSQDVEVEAAEAGSEYNIGPSAFSIPGFAGTPRYLGFYGKSKNVMAGGFVGEVEVVAAGDIDEAKSELEKMLSGKIQSELLANLPAGFEVLGAPAEKIEGVTLSLGAGEAGKSFKADASMRVTAFIIRSDDLLSFIEQRIVASLPLLMEEVRHMRHVEKTINEADIVKGTIRGAIDISTKIVHQFNQEELRNALKSQDSEKVRAALYDDERIKKALISFWPMWATRVPKNPDKIKIEVVSPEEE